MPDLSSPDWFPVRIDFPSGLVSFVEMDANAYRSSVFLDSARISPRSRTIHEIPFSQLPDIAVVPRPAFIFHAAFCCSSLVARAIELGSHTLVLKEPFWVAQYSALRKTPEEAKWRSQLNVAAAMLGRVYEPGQTAVVKSSDLANGVADLIGGQSQVIFMTTSLERFLVSILKYPGRREWARNRLRSLPWLRGELMPHVSVESIRFSNDAQCAALLWCLYDRLRLRLRALFGKRFFDVLDDELVDNRDVVMEQIFRHLGVAATLPIFSVNEIVFQIHAKSSLGARFSPRHRQEEFVAARRLFSSEIDPVLKEYGFSQHSAAV